MVSVVAFVTTSHRPPTKLWEDNAFSSVCYSVSVSVCSQGVTTVDLVEWDPSYTHMGTLTVTATPRTCSNLFTWTSPYRVPSLTATRSCWKVGGWPLAERPSCCHVYRSVAVGIIGGNITVFRVIIVECLTVSALLSYHCVIAELGSVKIILRESSYWHLLYTLNQLCVTSQLSVVLCVV